MAETSLPAAVRHPELARLIGKYGVDEGFQRYRDGEVCEEPETCEDRAYLQHALYAAQSVKVIEKVVGAVVKEIELSETGVGLLPTKIVFDGKILL